MCKVIAVETKSGSVYYYDTSNHKMSGTKLVGVHEVIPGSAEFKVGKRGKAQFKDGTVISTSLIVRTY